MKKQLVTGLVLTLMSCGGSKQLGTSNEYYNLPISNSSYTQELTDILSQDSKEKFVGEYFVQEGYSNAVRELALYFVDKKSFLSNSSTIEQLFQKNYMKNSSRYDDFLEEISDGDDYISKADMLNHIYSFKEKIRGDDFMYLHQIIGQADKKEVKISTAPNEEFFDDVKGEIREYELKSDK